MNISHMKFIYSIVLFILSIASTLVSAQEYKWAVPTQEPHKSYITGIVSDHSGNSYTVGVNGKRQDVIFSQMYVGDIFLTKRNSSGEVVWRRSFTGAARPYDIAIDSVGSLVISGSFTDSLELDKKYYHQNTFSALFLARLDGEGNIMWSRIDSSPEFGIANGASVACAANNSIFCCGMDGDITPFIAKYSSSGAVIWKRGFQDVRTIDDIALSPEGHIYISGTSNPYAMFDSIPIPKTKPETGYSIFLTRLDESGKVLWVRSNPFITFSLANALVFHNGIIHCFRNTDLMYNENRLEQYSEDGTTLSSLRIPYNIAPMDQVVANCLTVDSKGRAYIVDVTRDTIVIYRSRSFITPDTLLVTVDTFATLVARGSIGQGLTSDGDDLFLGASFTDGSIDVGKFTVMNTNNSSKYESSTFVTQIEIEPSLAVDGKDRTQELYLFPNPATTSISFLQNVIGSDIHVYDILGKEVLHSSFLQEDHLDVSSLPAGLYTATITDGKKTRTARFIIK
jgi:hypothetical protein